MVAIKTNNFSLSSEKRNATFDTSPDGLGWGPGYVAKREGVVINSEKYRKNYDKIDWSKK